MNTISTAWFDHWEAGSFRELPISEDFTHRSPFGVVQGKSAYLALIEANQENFLGYRFEIHDVLEIDDRCCIRYSAVQGDFQMEVCEWHYMLGGLISEIDAYYHVGDEIREDRRLRDDRGYRTD